MNLSKFIETHVSNCPSTAAIVVPGFTLEYSELSRFVSGLNEKSVFLYFQDIAAMTKTICGLDGSVKFLCANTSQMRLDDLNHILATHNFDTVISDCLQKLENIEALQSVAMKDFNNLDFKPSLSVKSHDSTMWLVPTSGTTSTPKLVKHTFQSLSSSAISKINAKSRKERWGLLYDATRYAGYQVLFNSLINGHTLVAPSFELSLGERLNFIVQHGVTHLSATATMWRNLLMLPAIYELKLHTIVIGGEAADQQILDALNKAFPTAKIIHTYASTEVGFAMSVSDGRAGYPISFLKANPKGVSAKVSNGTLHLRSASVSRGYLSEDNMANKTKWIDTGDLVEIDKDRFYILGRANGVLNIGGDKVLPEQVRSKLLMHPLIKEAKVYGKQNPITGTLLAADIQMHYCSDKDKNQILISEFIRGIMPSWNRPRYVRFVDEIQLNATGKVDQRQC